MDAEIKIETPVRQRHEVEVDIAQGLPQFATVGLPEGAVKESKDRVKSAIKNSGYDFPTRRITINLAPADIRKDGAAFDLPMAVGLLSATGLKNFLGKRGLIAMERLMGMVLIALAVQMLLEGVTAFVQSTSGG